MTESQHLHALCSGFHPPDCMWLEPWRPLSWRNVKTVLNYWTRVNSKRTLVTRRLLGPQGFCTMVESRLLTCQWPEQSPTFTVLLSSHLCSWTWRSLGESTHNLSQALVMPQPRYPQSRWEEGQHPQNDSLKAVHTWSLSPSFSFKNVFSSSTRV